MTGVYLSLVAAVARNGVIGAKQGMPWRLSTDLQRFKRLTMGKPVIMGRKTFDAIGKPLAGRTNIVVSRRGRDVAGVTFAPSLEAAIGAASSSSEAQEIMVIGGGELYAAAVGRADRLYITHVEATPEGDTYFPAIDPALWREVSSEHVTAGEKDSAETRFVVYERRADPPSVDT